MERRKVGDGKMEGRRCMICTAFSVAVAICKVKRITVTRSAAIKAYLVEEHGQDISYVVSTVNANEKFSPFQSSLISAEDSRRKGV